MQITAEKGKTVIVEGEASIKILDGNVEVFGANYKQDDVLIVPSAKAVPLYVKEKLVAEILFSENGRIKEVDENTIPSDWDAVATEIMNIIKEGKKKPVVLFIGDVDTGKTTLITYTMNKLSQQGYDTAIIDADTGQSDVGPPTSIGLGILKKGSTIYALHEVEFVDAFFLGLTSPAGLLHRSIAGVHRMVARAKELDTSCILVDTTGWVYDHNARDLKLLKVLTVNPDLIVLIEKNKELEYYNLMFSKFYRVIRVSSSKYVRPRDREERKQLRQKMYTYYLFGGKEIELNLTQIPVFYSFLWTGTEINDDETLSIISSILGVSKETIEYVEETSDCIIVVLSSNCFVPEDKINKLKETFVKREVKVITKDVFQNLLVGLVDNEFRFLAIGTITDIDLKNKKVKVFTKADPEKVSAVMFGYLKVTPDGEEIGWTGHWPF
ncbi:MAG: Clp1/GlmU family protein [Candidatus Asgardarchaeia archaeon]